MALILGKMKNYRKQNFIEITKTEFQKYTSSPISNEQSLEIQKNLFGFVDLLLDWSQKEHCNNETQV